MIYRYSFSPYREKRPCVEIRQIDGYFKTEKTVVHIPYGQVLAKDAFGGYAKTWDEAKAALDARIEEKMAEVNRQLQYVQSLADMAKKIQKT